jgi:hypothetical protein
VKVRLWLPVLFTCGLLGGLAACGDSPSASELSAGRCVEDDGGLGSFREGVEIVPCEKGTGEIVSRGIAGTECPLGSRGETLRNGLTQLCVRPYGTTTTTTADPTGPATTTTTTKPQFTGEELNWIQEELSGFVDTSDLVATAGQGRCILQRFVKARGVSGAEALVERVDHQSESGNRLSPSDADAFLDPIVACVDLVQVTRRDIKSAEPDLDAWCVVTGLAESRVADWYRTFFVEGEAAMQATMNEWLLPSVSRCLGIPPASTAAPATTRPPLPPRPPPPALPEFSSKKEWTYGDEVTWLRWCGDLRDLYTRTFEPFFKSSMAAAMVPGSYWNRCKDALEVIEKHISERRWAKSCAIRYEYLDLLQEKPDPYMCE